MQLKNVTERQNSSVRNVGANWKWLSWNHSDYFGFIGTRGVKFDLLVIDNFHSILEKSHLFFFASAMVRLHCRRGKALNFWDAVWDLKLQQHDMHCYAHLCCINKYPKMFSRFCLFYYWKQKHLCFQNGPQRVALHLQRFSDWQGATGQIIESHWKLEAMSRLDMEAQFHRYYKANSDFTYRGKWG